MNHPVLSAYAAIDAAFDEISAVDPTYMTVEQRKAALTCSAKARARAEAWELRLLAASDDISHDTGARSTAAWVADQTRDAHGAVRRRASLAASLDQRWARVADSLESGSLNLAQARVIAEALDALPRDLDGDLLAKAGGHLVEKAAEFGPRDLARLGQRVLEVIAPDIAEEAEYERLLAEERRSRRATRLFFRTRGDGSTDVNARVPDHVANRLRTYLDGYTSPRNKRLGDVDSLPLSRRRGEAFCAFLENMPSSGLPRQGGTATTVSVRVDYEALVKRLGEAGVAVTSTGDPITADQARRLACQAGIVPFVMSGKSVIHDQGRKKRFHDEPQRLALRMLHPECTAVGCAIPAAWCEVHHKVHWCKGGKTRVEDGTLLCPFHHHRAHDPGWMTRHDPNGETTFTRRQ